MAPKKTILLLTLVLFAGITAAQSATIESQSTDSVWLGSENPEVEIEVNFDSECTSNDLKVSGPENHDSPNEVQETSTTYTTYTFSDFASPGIYNFTATCGEGENDETSVNADRLNLSIPEDEVPRDGVIEYGDSFEIELDVSSENGLIDVTFEDVSLESDLNSFSDEGDRFTAEAPETRSGENDNLEFEVDAVVDETVLDSVSGSFELDPYSVEDFTTLVSDDSVNQRVKFRRMQDVSLEFRLLKRGNPITDLSLDDFEFDGSSGSEWFDMNNQGDGNYRLDLKRTTSPEGSGYKELDYPISVDSSSDSFGIGTLKMEREVEFSGKVLDINRGSVSTTFTATFDEGGETTGSTGENGNFQFYFSENKADRLDIDFPRAGFSLDQFNFVREGPSSTGSNVDDIRYNYYESPGENLDLSVEEVRPINLMSAKVDYGFKEDIDNTRGYMEYDSSRVDNYDEVEVYECSYWEFEAESCATEWDQIPENDVGFYSTSVPEFPVTPLSSDRFRGVENILSNAYLVGVPQGVGSSLTLEEGSVNGLPGRIQAGEEFSFSGTVIDSSTGEPVENADVSIELVSDGNDPVSPEDDISTNEDGEFEYTDSIEQAGEYSVSLDVSKNPYESFSFEGDSTMEVYYQTGLTVSAGENIDLQLGESSVIDFTLENTGQSEIQDLSGELDVTGIDDQYYSWSGLGSDALESGEELTASLELTIPSSDDVTPGQKTVTLTASGSSADESLENSATVYATVPVQEEQDEQDSESSDTQEQNESGSPSVPGPQEVSQMTGEFVQSQSDMNLALGLILIFGAILAVTVRERKESDGRDGRMNGRTAAAAGSATGSAGGRGKVQRPKVSPEVEETQEEEKEEKDQAEQSGSEESEETEESDDEDDSDEFVCDKCGETFDTESGLKLHSQALH